MRQSVYYAVVAKKIDVSKKINKNSLNVKLYQRRNWPVPKWKLKDRNPQSR